MAGLHPFNPQDVQKEVHLPIGVISGTVRGWTSKSSVEGEEKFQPVGISMDKIRVGAVVQGPDRDDGQFRFPTFSPVGTVEYGDASMGPDGHAFELPYSIQNLPIGQTVIVGVSSSSDGGFFTAVGWPGQTSLSADQSELNGADFRMDWLR